MIRASESPRGWWAEPNAPELLGIESELASSMLAGSSDRSQSRELKRSVYWSDPFGVHAQPGERFGLQRGSRSNSCESTHLSFIRRGVSVPKCWKRVRRLCTRSLSGVRWVTGWAFRAGPPQDGIGFD